MSVPLRYSVGHARILPQHVRDKSSTPQGATRIIEASDWIIELYTATNKPGEVMQWRAERARYPRDEQLVFALLGHTTTQTPS